MNQDEHNSTTEPTTNVRTITIHHNTSNSNSNGSSEPPSQESSTTTYTLRSLTCEKEVDPTWTSFCRDCFRDKQPNPPTAEYFSRHYFHDPFRYVRFIRVLTTTNNNEEERIASTVRIFRRRVSTGGSGDGTTLSAGGIGEVCTAHSHRRRGLTGILLNDALDLMTTSTTGGGDRMDCSLLHAAPAFQPFYQRTAGYTSVVSHWSVIPFLLLQNNRSSSRSTMDGGPTTTTHPKTRVRRAEFPNDTNDLQRIHRTYSEERFVGCIIRTRDYWNDYLAREIGDSLWVLTVAVVPNDDDGDDGNGGSVEEEEEEGKEDTNVIVAWISIRDRGEKYQLRDFGVDAALSDRMGLSTSYLMGKLLQAAIEPFRLSITDGMGGTSNSLRLHLPTPILNELGVWSTSNGEGGWNPDGVHSDNDWIDRNGVVTEENDTGWMYRFFTDGENEESTMLKRWKQKDHLIWPADSF